MAAHTCNPRPELGEAKAERSPVSTHPGQTQQLNATLSHNKIIIIKRVGDTP